MKLRDYLELLCEVTGEQCGPDFAKELMKEAAHDNNFDSILSNQYADKIKSYIRKDRNISENLAAELLAVYKPKCLIGYLKDRCDTPQRIQKLCEVFKPYCPDITRKNAYKLVAEQFQLLLESAGKRKKCETTKATKDDRNEIESIIVRIQNTMDDLLINAGILPLVPISAKEKVQHEIEQKHMTFLELNTNLHFFLTLYPQLEVINKLYRGESLFLCGWKDASG